MNMKGSTGIIALFPHDLAYKCRHIHVLKKS